MIGLLPNRLLVGGLECPIRTDFRIALHIFQAWNDPELNDYEKSAVMLQCLYQEEIPAGHYEEACRQAAWFLDGGPLILESKPQVHQRVMDWEQDEPIIFSAVNKVAGFETREREHLHWWTFLGLYNEIGESLFASVLAVRVKKSKGKKLEKQEQEFYKENKTLIDLKKKRTRGEQETMDAVTRLLRPR